MTEKIERIAEGVTLYLGDCREIVPTLPPVDAIVSDPVWPDCPPGLLPGSDDPDGLFGEFCATLAIFPSLRQLVVWLRATSDPRILRHIPSTLPFQQAMWLRYAVPNYLGRTLGGNEIAYVFGKAVRSAPSRRVVPSMSPVIVQPRRDGATGHPCSRAPGHQDWLINWCTDVGETVLDPFMGAGECAIACLKSDRRFIGIEIEPRYFDIACRRVAEAVKQSRLALPQPKAPPQELLFPVLS